MSQVDYMVAELSGIEWGELTKTEKNIWNILTDNQTHPSQINKEGKA